ncbi:MAG: polysaccharide deacetylase family protein [Chloroflexi bacterium]|nr:polysaccharide deacetylase family protein [Chloroflexota bacterium]
MTRPVDLIVFGFVLVIAVTACGASAQTNSVAAAPYPTVPPPTTTVISTPVKLPPNTPAPTSIPAPTLTPIPKPSSTPTRTAPSSNAVDRLSGEPEARNVVKGDASRPLVALTFDAGSDAEGTEAIMAVLRQYGVHSTFFLTGAWVKRYPDMARKMVADGHELGNHSFDHPDFTKISNARMVSEIAETEELIRKVTGVGTKPWFRAPFGAYDSRVLRVLHSVGYVSIYWTLDSADWRNETTARDVSDRVLGKTGNGYIVVHHASPQKTAEALKRIIPGLKRKDLSLVTLSKLLAN